MNIVLVGYRGTGKTAVGTVLAQKLGLTAIHLDSEIVRVAGRSIPEIVANRGWAGFRDLEEEIVRTYTAYDGQVIDCGGGVIEREANFSRLQSAGPVIWLKASVDRIVDRIGGDHQRPSLTGVESFTDEVAEVLHRRTPLYRRIAHFEIDTDQLTVNEVAEQICRLVHSES
ncbi:MAG: shikimate kinase [Pirellulales bacterium]|nr:shikimate kinase [Pirellulales bacterium]